MKTPFWIVPLVLVLLLGLSLVAKPLPPASPKEDDDLSAVEALPQGAVGRIGTLSLRHGAHTLKFSPDGRMLASAGQVTRIFDGRSGRFVRDLSASSSYVAFSPDSKLIFTSPYGFKAAVKIWNAGNGTERFQFTADGGVSFFPDWSRDGKTMIASCFKQGAGFKVTLWDMATGNELRTFINPTNDRDGSQVAFTPDGKSFAIQGRQNLYLFDSATGQEVRRFASVGANGGGRTLETQTFAFSADGKKLACTDAGNVTLWSIDGQAIHRLTVPSGLAVTAALSPDAQFVAAGTSDGALVIWDAQTGKLLHTFKDPNINLPIYLLAFSPDSKTLASQQHIVPLVRLWDVRTGRDLSTHAGPGTPINTVALTPSGDSLFALDAEGKIWRWTKNEVELLHRFPNVQANTGGGGRLAVLADARTLLLDKGGPHLWDLKTAKGPDSKPATPNGVPARRYFPDLSPDDGKSIVVAFSGGVKRQIIVNQGPPFRLPPPNPLPPNPLPPNRLPPNQPLPKGENKPQVPPPQIPAPLPAQPGPGPGGPRMPPPPPRPPIDVPWTMIGLWDVLGDKQGKSFQVDAENLSHLALDSKGKKLAGIGSIPDGNGNAMQTMIFVWDLTGKELLRVPLQETDNQNIAFSADGKTLITGPHYSPQTRTCTLCRWDVAKGTLSSRQPCAPEMPQAPILALAGDRLAAFAAGNTIHVVDVGTGKELRQFAGHKEWISCVTFSADARFLASGSQDTTALIWDLTKLAAGTDKAGK